MHVALQSLVGSHNFRAFAGGEEPGASTVRNVTYATCRRSGDTVRIKVEANAFIRHMMRRIVGTALEIGEGRKPTEHMEQVLAAGKQGTGRAHNSRQRAFLDPGNLPGYVRPKEDKRGPTDMKTSVTPVTRPE